MLALLRWPADRFRRWSDAWLRNRLPRTRSLTLNQRRIFILPTRNGLFFLLTLVLIFLGGVNYGNSLLLATAFLLASLFLVSILHTYANLSGLHLDAGRAGPAFVGGEAAFSLALRSRGDREHEALRLRWAGATECLVDRVDGGRREVRMLLPVGRRGRYRPSRLKVESGFPLGLLNAWSWIELDMQCLVYPRPSDCEYPRRRGRPGEEGERLPHDGSDDFDGLKRYIPGDSLRHVAWKHYARSGELHTKRFVGHQARETWLDWDAFAGVGVEERLSRLCFWVLRLGDQERVFGLSLPGLAIPPGCGSQHRQRCLEALALYGLES